jgi:hypothetical protein
MSISVLAAPQRCRCQMAPISFTTFGMENGITFIGLTGALKCPAASQSQ